MTTDWDFDVIIIGAGVAGLSAALFTARECLQTFVGAYCATRYWRQLGEKT